MANARPCSIDGCERPHFGKGWCSMHYTRMRRYGSLDDPRASARRRALPPCVVEGCDEEAGRPGTARGFCAPHYYRWQKYGDPLGGHEHLNKGKACSVDGCAKPAVARGICSMHFTRVARHGSLDHPEAWGRAPEGMRWCARCQSYKAVGDFYANRSRPDGRSTWCSACDRAKQIRWRRENPEKVAQYHDQRYRRVAGRGIRGIEVAGRDGWRCGICGKAIQRRPWPHPLSLSIDHIVPLAVGGEHVLANVQASHLRCNLSKGKRGTDQLRLIG